MQMLYNSDSYVVLRFEPAAGGDPLVATRGGLEIVDKRAQREAWLEGALAERFIAGAQALAAGDATADDYDDYIADFARLAQQPLSLH